MVTDQGCKSCSVLADTRTPSPASSTQGFCTGLSQLTLATVFLEQDWRREILLLDAAGCVAQGTLEWFSVRHEPVYS